ncbi:MAG: ABC transporter permease [Firmicutes bacterium]|nr:ABC transporter permease [Bacillota bacterium]
MHSPAVPRWQVELSAVYVLWLREMLHLVRQPVELAVSFVQPAIFLIVFGLGVGKFFQLPQASVSYGAYLFSGLMAINVLFTALASGSTVTEDRRAGFLREIVVAPVSRFAVVGGKALAGTTSGLVQGLIVLCFAPLVKVHCSFFHGLAAVGILVLLGFALACLGILLGVRLRSSQAFTLLMNFVMMPLTFLSGAFFPLSPLPGWFQAVARVDPLAYGVDALNALLLNTHLFSFQSDLAVLIAIAVLFASLAAVLFRSEET